MAFINTNVECKTTLNIQADSTIYLPLTLLLINIYVFSSDKMGEKLWLQWNDFKDNADIVLKSLRNDNDFSDVTLVCEDGDPIEAHKVILAGGSPIFQNMLAQNKQIHPLIFMRGVESSNVKNMLDFLYCGQARVPEEDLDSFLAIAEELKLKGLAQQFRIEEKEVKEDTQSDDLMKKQDNFSHKTVIMENPDMKSRMPKLSTSDVEDISREKGNGIMKSRNPKLVETSLIEDLDFKVKSLMEKTGTVTSRKRPNGEHRRRTLYICKVCGKEGIVNNISDHIEANHLEGIFLQCGFCEKTFGTRQCLRYHNSHSHKQNRSL